MKQRKAAHVFAVPGLLALSTLLGLLSALLGDGAWDVLSWLALAALPAVAAVFVWQQRSPR